MEVASMSTGELFTVSVVFFLIALIFYNIFCLFCDHVSAYRIDVAINATALVIISFICIRYYNPSFYTDRSGPNTVSENMTVSACLGYYTFDTLYYIWYWKKTSKVMLLHHVVTWFGLFTCLYLQISGTEISIIICGTEVTTPFLIAQRFLSQDSKLQRTISFLLYVFGTGLFVLFRMVIGTYLMTLYLPDPKGPLIFRILGFSLYALSFPFFIAILRFGLKNFKTAKQEKTAETSHVANNNDHRVHNNGFVKVD